MFAVFKSLTIPLNVNSGPECLCRVHQNSRRQMLKKDTKLTVEKYKQRSREARRKREKEHRVLLSW